MIPSLVAFAPPIACTTAPINSRRSADNSNQSLTGIGLALGLTRAPREPVGGKGLLTLRNHLEPFRGLSLSADALVDEIVEAIADIERCTERVPEIERRLRPFVEDLAPGLLKLTGVATVVAAGLFGNAGSLRHCRDANAFAMRAGVAPLTFASGNSSSVRVNYLGNRQLNRCLHVIALTQMRLAGHEGRVYYERKRSEGKTHRSALRDLNRQLATVTYYRLRDESSLGRSHAPIPSANTFRRLTKPILKVVSLIEKRSSRRARRSSLQRSRLRSGGAAPPSRRARAGRSQKTPSPAVSFEMAAFVQVPLVAAVCLASLLSEGALSLTSCLRFGSHYLTCVGHATDH